MLEQQPNDIEKLTEIGEFMETIVEKSDTLLEDIAAMTSHYEILEELQVLPAGRTSRRAYFPPPRPPVPAIAPCPPSYSPCMCMRMPKRACPGLWGLRRRRPHLLALGLLKSTRPPT